jgi:hypothetical protein
MTQIYSDAAVTISAAVANTVYSGFLDMVKFSHEAPLKVTLENEQKSLGTIYMQQPKTYNIEDEPISLRAWTLQEHILSQRILMFTTHDVWWICPSGTKSQDGPVDEVLEDGDNTAPPVAAAARYSSTGPLRHNKMKVIKHWRLILEDYTRRFLSYPSDKLPAIGGIASLYANVLCSEYRAGLWMLCLRSDLMWSSKRSDISRPTVARAPSWSWASVDGEITHDWCPPPLAGALEILECCAPPLSVASPFGSIDPLKSILRVRGELGKFYWRKDRQYIFTLPPEPDDWMEGWDENKGYPRYRYVCLPFTRSHH